MVNRYLVNIMTQEYYTRHLVAWLETALDSFKIVYIVGPRQVGKTTLGKDLFQKGKYITLDDVGVLETIETDPVEFLKSLRIEAGDEPVIIDEAQRSKNLPLAIKLIVDNDNRKGQFILIGPSNVFSSNWVPDTLPGRVVPIELWPLSITEIRRKPPSRLLDWLLQKGPSLTQIERLEILSREEYITLILAGGFPDPRELPIRERQILYRKYLHGIVDRDVREVFPIRKPDKFRRLIIQMASRTAQEINRVELSRQLDLRWETVDSYLELLMKLSLVIQVSAWTSSEAKREIKLPKFHFADTGLNCALRRFDKQSFDLGSSTIAQLRGLLESFVFNEILRMLPYQSKDFRLYHWRSADRREIDIIAEGGGQIIGIEVKAASTVNLSDFKHLKWFAKQGPGKSLQFKGIVFYLGDMELSFGDNCFALPVSTLWAEIGV